jgi:signal peptidase II
MTQVGPGSATTPVAGLVLVVAGAVLALDQLTKSWAVEALADGPIHVVWTLDLNLATNTGAAFSSGQGFGWLIGLLASVAVLILLRFRHRVPGRAGAIALGAILGGALGNLADRMFRGRGWMRGPVIDFIDLNWWPIFNVADIAVSLGVITLVVLLAARPSP